MGFAYIILFLHFIQGTGVRGAKLILENNCSEIIWPAIPWQPTLSGLELHPGNSTAVQPPAYWFGQLWGRTGCNFSALGNGSCATGDCGSGQLECQNYPDNTTVAEFTLQGDDNKDHYDVSLLNGFNLPLVIEPSGQCQSAGCAKDLNLLCPPELSTQGGRACQGSYTANYTRMFKKACPEAMLSPRDKNARFGCSSGGDIFITFCPASLAQTRKRMPAAQSPAYSPSSTTNGLPPAQSPGYSPIPKKINGSTPAQSPGYSPIPRKINEKKHSKMIIIVVALSITCVVIISIILLCFHKKRHSKSALNKENKQHIENFLLQHGSVAPKRYKYSEIKKITKSLSDKLGKGGYGSVYKGVLPDSSLVAVKVLMETDSNGEEFMNEVASISRTSHVNVVTLLGFCYEGEKRALVYEFMPNKSLDKFLSTDGSAENTDFSLDLEVLYKIAIGIAKGLEYLHTGCNTRIVHFDIKPQNILLDVDFCPKISDFGLAKLFKKKQSVLSVFGTRGTIGYIAPEVFSRAFGGVSHKSDVYSYGMMVLEMAGAKKIGEADPLQSSENYFPDKIYEHAILGITTNLAGFMIEDVEETTKKMFLVGFWCIQTTPSNRPSMSKVIEMLEGSIESVQIPPKPVLFTPPLPQEQFSSSLSAYTEADNSIEVIATG
ncbi:hypothetical protein ACS0TY_008586 [Phlomoides rotata]